MASARFAWGIDVGNRALKAIKLVPDGDRLRVDDLEVIEHEQILSQSGDNRDALVQSALQNFAQRHPTKGGAVAMSLSGQASFARFIKLPPVEEKKIPEIVKFEAIQQIPFSLEEVEWSYQLFRGADTTDVEVGIFAIRKDRLGPIMDNYSNLGMSVSHVQLSPLAVYNAMQYDQRIQGPTMVVDLGAENTDLVIADGETVWLRTIAVGGNNFTEALAKAFKLNFAKAEDLKRNAATSKYARQIFQAMRPVFADLVSEIQRSMGFYASVHRESRIKRIIALGSTFKLPTLQKYLQQNLQMEVERIDGFGGGGAPADARIAATLNENLVSMATAYGLAVQAMDRAKITSSLLPEPIRKAKLWKSKVKWFGVAAALCIAGASAGYAKWYIDRQSMDSHAEDGKKVDQIISRAEKVDKDWQRISSEGADQLARIKGMLEMPAYRDIWPKLMADIARSLPPIPADGFQGVERKLRKQVTIDSIQSEYRPDVSDLLKLDDDGFKRVTAGASGAAPAVAAEGGGAAPVAQAGSARGFLLTLRCITPNEKASVFLQDNDGMIAKLLELNPAAAIAKGRPYYIAKATVSAVKQIKDSADPAGGAGGVGGRGGAATGGGNPATIGFTGETANLGTSGVAQPVQPGGLGERVPGTRGMGSRGPVAPGVPENVPSGVAQPTGPTFPDPIDPKQDMGEDWDLTVLVLVVLDPPAATTPATPTGTASAVTPR